jgi:arylsulfatase A-like enzyme
MKHFLLIMLATCGPLGMSFATAWSSEPPRPNIVVILADDMGFSDIGCYGSEIKTPNLDKLAAGGLRFTQFYNTGRCCPTRAALLTGLYSHQAGVGHMTYANAGPSPPGYIGHLNHRCLTIAEALAPAGYHTLMAGKWHVGGEAGMRPVGSEAGMWPVNRGFEHYYGIIGGAANYFRPGDGRWGPLALDHR